MRAIIGIGCIVLAIICLADLPFTRRVNLTLGGFFLMNGKLRLPGFVASILSANLSLGNFLIFIATWGYLFGWGGLFWFLVNLVLNVIAYIVFIPAFKSYIEDPKNSGTIHEFLSTTFAGGSGQRYSRRIRLVASATTVLGLLFAIVFELHLATDILARVLNVDPVVVFALLTALICIYSGIGGFHTLVFTDILQSFAMIIGTLAVIPILVLLARLPTSVPLTTAYPLRAQTLAIGWPSIAGICIIGSGWFLVAMDQWQRTCATRDARRTRNGMIWYLVSISGFAVIFAFLGMFDKAAIAPALTSSLKAQHSGGANPLTDFFVAEHLVHGQSLLLGLVAIALIAAAMSTANTFLIVSGHSFVSDLLIGWNKGLTISEIPEAQSRAFVAVARSSIIGMGVFVIVAWLLMSTSGLLSDPLSFFFIAYSIQFALLAPMVFSRLPSRFWPSAGGVFLSICIGVITAIVCGLGFWFRLQRDNGLIMGLTVGDWLSLTPVITWLAGSIVLLGSMVWKGGQNDTATD